MTRSRRYALLGRWLPTGAVVAGLALLGASVPASAQTLTWSVVPSPNAGSDDSLNGVSCVSAAACTAVGQSITRRGIFKTLVESWHGTTWSLVPSPSPGPLVSFLAGVSCVSPAACTAVGGRAGHRAGSTLIESWNGTHWSVVPSPSPGSSGGTSDFLYGVSCASPVACTAVGERADRTARATLIESWNGARWSVVPSPNPGSGDVLEGVSCVSPAACMAVGSYVNSARVGSTLAESWNGTRWSVLPSPNPARGNGLNAVSCVAVRACTAVGTYSAAVHGTRAQRTLIESWNGTQWSAVPSPNRGAAGIDNSLDGVSCVSAAVCTAVGSSQNTRKGFSRTLVESWNGTNWSLTPSPNAAIVGNGLVAVSCVSSACTAAGTKVYVRGNTEYPRTLIESGTTHG